jgi:NADH-quinone oxidoreductase subunit H
VVALLPSDLPLAAVLGATSIDLFVLIEAIIFAALLAFVLVTGFAYSTLLERKLIGRMQVRYGPNRVGPFGLLQPAADGVKLFFKEDIVPGTVDRSMYFLAPVIMVCTALLAFAVIPIGPRITIGGRSESLALIDVNVGILFTLAVTSITVYGVVLAGWASNNKYSLLGGIRSAAQMISYELAIGLGLVGVMLVTGSLNMQDIVGQQDKIWTINAIRTPIGFVVYLLAGIAETNRAPFDLAEAEGELGAGYHTEYAGMRFGMFFLAEYVNMITVSAIATTFFLGGWQGPWVSTLPLLGVVWFILKVFLGMCGYMWLRATLPRMRYDRLMRLGWLVMLPAGIINVLWASFFYALWQSLGLV